MSPKRAVRVKAEEQIGLAVVRGRRALVDADRAVVIARQDDPNAEAAFDQPAQPPRDVERELLLLETVGAANADLVAAVPRIDHQRLQRLRGSEAGQPRRLRSSAAVDRSAGSVDSGVGSRASATGLR